MSHEMRVRGHAACNARTTGNVWQQSPIADRRNTHTEAGGVVTEVTETSVNNELARATLFLCDRSRRDDLTNDHFNPAWWRKQGAELGTARGRGEVHFVQSGEQVWALRHYRRGGWMGRFVADSYFWRGLQSTRPWREWHVLQHLRSQGFPVPEPIAARVSRRGLFYRGDLITRRIEGTVTLTHVLQHRSLSGDDWGRIGTLLRKFQDIGLRHDDVNVSNILIDAEGAFHLIDFDKACFVAPGPWRTRNLARFQRSLQKQLARNPNFAFNSAAWDALVESYSG